jgi:hypothetical protein
MIMTLPDWKLEKMPQDNIKHLLAKNERTPKNNMKHRS